MEKFFEGQGQRYPADSTLESESRDRWQGDPRKLEAELRERIQGEVRFDTGSRALYATDASNYRQVPIGVVIPKDTEDVIETIKVCYEHGAPVLPRGGGTSLGGQCCNVAVILDMTKYMNRVLEVDPEKKLARVQPGVYLDELRNEAEKFELTFGPDPATHTHCSLGGMIGNNSCGVHSVMAGRTVDNVEELEILTYDGLRMKVGKTSEEELEQIISQGGRRGEIYARLKDLRGRYADRIRERFPDIPRLVSGYGLQHLLPENAFNVARALVGSEGTCVTVLEATVHLVDSRPERTSVVLAVFVGRIDEDHANPKKKWDELGKPEYLSSYEVDMLKAVSEMTKQPLGWSYDQGTVRVQLSMPPQSVAAVTLELGVEGIQNVLSGQERISEA